MRKIDSYKHLDKDTAMTLTLPMEQIASECVRLNYGAHRLLSAMVHALREANNEYAAEHPNVPPEPSELADGIEALLNKGLFF
jgi:hypothetical protein